MKKRWIYFNVPLGPFNCRKFKIKRPICPKKNFGKAINNFHVPLGPFHCAKFLKKFFEWIQSYNGTSFLGPKWPISPKEFFQKKPLILFSCTFWSISLWKIWTHTFLSYEEEDIVLTSLQKPLNTTEIFHRKIFLIKKICTASTNIPTPTILSLKGFSKHFVIPPLLCSKLSL